VKDVLALYSTIILVWIFSLLKGQGCNQKGFRAKLDVEYLSGILIASLLGSVWKRLIFGGAEAWWRWRWQLCEITSRYLK